LLAWSIQPVSDIPQPCLQPRVRSRKQRTKNAPQPPQPRRSIKFSLTKILRESSISKSSIFPPDSFPAVLHPPANASHPPGREIRLLLEKPWGCWPRPPNPTLRDLIWGMKETTTSDWQCLYRAFTEEFERQVSRNPGGASKQQRQANVRLSSIPPPPLSPSFPEILNRTSIIFSSPQSVLLIFVSYQNAVR
jgi:hypothetical protein